MNTYLIIIDNSSARCAPNPQPIYNFFETLEQWVRLKEDTYVVVTGLTKEEIEKYIRNVTIDWARYYIITLVNDYLVYGDEDVVKFIEKYAINKSDLVDEVLWNSLKTRFSQSQV